MFPGNKRKAVTFSYDDGILQDERFIDILNKYGLKATFNINYGLLDNKGEWEHRGVTVKRIDKDKVNDLYKGHEIACHSLSHPSLVDLNDSDLNKELTLDKEGLEALTNRTMTGMAYPFGTFDDRVIDAMKEVGIKYGRTVEDTKAFDLPKDFYRWHPTCHHNDQDIYKLIDDFINDESDDLKLLYIWGHTYEFDMDDNWDHFETIAKKLSHKKDVWYATNEEIFNYMNKRSC